MHKLLGFLMLVLSLAGSAFLVYMTDTTEWSAYEERSFMILTAMFCCVFFALMGVQDIRDRLSKIEDDTGATFFGVQDLRETVYKKRYPLKELHTHEDWTPTSEDDLRNTTSAASKDKDADL